MGEEFIQYCADDGLRVLEYLGLENLSVEEKLLFRSKWDEFYELSGRDFVSTVWVLYTETLPFMYGKMNKGSLVLSSFRDSDFDRRLKNKGLKKELSGGKSLSEIINFP